MSAAEVCAKEKGANKKACLQFFNASTGQEGLDQMIATLTKKKKKKKSKAQKALGINK